MTYLERLKNQKGTTEEPTIATPEFSEMPTVVTAKTAISPFDSFDSSQGGHIQENEILQKLAEGMAAELGTTTAFCFAMLDDDDIQAIATGSDPGRAAAWRGHVGLAVQRNEAPRAKP